MSVLSSVRLIECMLLTMTESTPWVAQASDGYGSSGGSRLGWGHVCACDGKPWEAMGPTLVQPIVPPFLPYASLPDSTCWELFLHKSQAAQAHAIPLCH